MNVEDWEFEFDRAEINAVRAAQDEEYERPLVGYTVGLVAGTIATGTENRPDRGVIIQHRGSAITSALRSGLVVYPTQQSARDAALRMGAEDIEWR